jgi:hypothetical protein
MRFRVLSLVALLAVAVPAVADDWLMMTMPWSTAARSMLLWPPNLPVPNSVYFLFNAQGPVTEPYRVQVLWDRGMRTLGPAPGIGMAYLSGLIHRLISFSLNRRAGQGATDAGGMTAVILPRAAADGAPPGISAHGSGNLRANLDLGLMVNSPDLDGDLLVTSPTSRSSRGTSSASTISVGSVLEWRLEPERPRIILHALMRLLERPARQGRRVIQ